MARIHFFEIEDQRWCPASIRDGITDYLQFAINAAKPYAPIAGRLADAIRRSGSGDVVDLCSGAGGPWLTLSKTVSESVGPVRVTLTDWQPNVDAFRRASALTDGGIRFHESPVDARRVPSERRGSRTLFSSFHHFKPGDALAVLFDGIVSCLRTYTPDELLALTEGIDGYRWDAGEERAKGPVPVTFLLGVPNTETVGTGSE